MKLNAQVIEFNANDDEGNIMHWTAEVWRAKDDDPQSEDYVYARFKDANGKVLFEIEVPKLADLHDALVMLDQVERAVMKLGSE